MSLGEIQDAVVELVGAEVDFKLIPQAEAYYQSKRLASISMTG